MRWSLCGFPCSPNKLLETPQSNLKIFGTQVCVTNDSECSEQLFDFWVEYYEKLKEEDHRRLPLKPVYFLSPEP
jgi:hypothetical protein